MIAHTAKHSLAFHYEVVGRVILALKGRLDESFSLSTIAAIAFVSRFHFNRIFRQVTGIPPCQFFYAMRLAEAKLLLLTTRLKVIDICYNVGYQSLGTFTRRFTELVGVSPSRFRAQARSCKDRPFLLADLPDEMSGEGDDRALSGMVFSPATFKGTVFIALFEDPIPQGRPTTCTAIESDGSFRMGGLEDGTYYLFAMALPAPVSSASLFHSPNALRAGGQSITVANSMVKGKTELFLRPPELFDPPILLAIPPLLSSAIGLPGLRNGIPQEMPHFAKRDIKTAWSAN